MSDESRRTLSANPKLRWKGKQHSRSTINSPEPSPTKKKPEKQSVLRGLTTAPVNERNPEEEALQRLQQVARIARMADPKDKRAQRKDKWKNRLKFYSKASSFVVFIGSLSMFVFLIPLVANPALVSLQANFKGPTECRVLSVEEYVGIKNCSWTSCREGCTADIYKCFHVTVEYSPVHCHESIDNSVICDGEPIQGRLAVNALSCGYPPTVNCTEFRQLYENLLQDDQPTVPCYYSVRDPLLTVISYDADSLRQSLILSFTLPLIGMAVSAAALVISFKPWQKPTRAVAQTDENCNAKTPERVPSLREKQSESVVISSEPTSTLTDSSKMDLTSPFFQKRDRPGSN